MTETTIFSRERVTIVGVLNVTPDSFSDGGRFVGSPERHDDGEPVDLDAVLRTADAMARAGVDILDVGGESTRPGARAVAADAEIRRTAPVVAALAKRFELPVSIDTRKAKVAEAALDAGARIVNDVSGGAYDPELFSLVAERDAFIVIGHLRGEPEGMQRGIHFDDVVGEVADELRAAADRAIAAGVARERIAIDPGIGFGKRLAENLDLIANVAELRERTGFPVWIGLSRKSFLGELTGDPTPERDLASHVAGGIAAFCGADALRVHDVPGAARAVKVGQALRAARRDVA